MDGLYAFVAGALLYAILGTNRHLSVGADSTIAPVLAVGVAPIAVFGTADYRDGMAVVYLIYAPLWYANADHLYLRITQLISAAPEPMHAVVIDATAISGIDYTGLQTLRQLITELDQQHIDFAIARSSHLVHHDLKHGPLR